MLLMELTNSVRNRITFFLDINIIEEICFGQKLRIKICDFKECSPDKKYSFNIICSTQRVISTSIWRKLILYYEFNLLKSSSASPLGKWMWQNICSLRFHAVSLVPHIPNGFKGWLRKPWQPKETGPFLLSTPLAFPWFLQSDPTVISCLHKSQIVDKHTYYQHNACLQCRS